MVFESLPLQFVPSGMELAVILLIAILLFGANRIPKLARSTGQALGEFQRGRQQVEEELSEMQEQVEETTQSIEEPVATEDPTDVDDAADEDTDEEK